MCRRINPVNAHVFVSALAKSQWMKIYQSWQEYRGSNPVIQLMCFMSTAPSLPPFLTPFSQFSFYYLPLCPSIPSPQFSFQMFYYSDVTPVSVLRAEAVEEQAAVTCQRNPWIHLSVISQVDGERSLAWRHLLVDWRIVEAKLSRQLTLDRSSTLEPVVDVNTEATTRLFEFGRNVGRPLRSMCSELAHLRKTWSVFHEVVIYLVRIFLNTKMLWF